MAVRRHDPAVSSVPHPAALKAVSVIMVLTISLVILAAAWGMTRAQASYGAGAGNGPIRWAVLPLDLLPLGLGWLLLLSLTARPILSAIGMAAIAAGVTLGDFAKRETLREPLVFADRAEVFEVVRHPGLYIPFAGPARVAGIIVVTALAIAGLFWLEPRAPSPSPLLMLPICVAAVLLPGRPPLLGWLSRLYRRLQPTCEPAPDIRRFGLSACLVMHATLALDERAGRQAEVGPLEARAAIADGPVVLVQIESFFDARRLGDVIPGDLLPGWDRLTASGAMCGRLSVPCWGANTVRTEFSALTGIGSAALGLDRFNPYEKFARVRLPSIAWEMKRAGYRTICVHPFDPSFYGRDHVMPLLGFDEFRGPAAFEGAAQAGPYVSDEAVAAEIVRLVRDAGPKVFVFGVTMGNHGPWTSAGRHEALPGVLGLGSLPGAAEMLNFLQGLQGSDRMIATLLDGLPDAGVLAVYGDHQPSLPKAFDALDFHDVRTDYAIRRPGPGMAHDAAAEDLPALMLTSLQGSTSGRAMDSAVPKLS